MANSKMCEWCGQEPATTTYAKNPRINIWQLLNRLTEQAAKRPRNEQFTEVQTGQVVGEATPVEIGYRVGLEAELTIKQIRDAVEDVAGVTDSGSFAVCEYCETAIGGDDCSQNGGDDCED